VGGSGTFARQTLSSKQIKQRSGFIRRVRPLAGDRMSDSKPNPRTFASLPEKLFDH
jgi:hypothetical protein